MQLLILRRGEHWLCEIGRARSFAPEVFMVTLTLIGLLLSLVQVVILLRRK